MSVPIVLQANVSLAVDLEIVSPRAIVVPEGEHAWITTDNIAMVVDIAKYGANEDGVIFTMVIPPEHGRLILDSAITPAVSNPELAFTLHDIYSNKVVLYTEIYIKVCTSHWQQIKKPPQPFRPLVLKLFYCSNRI